MSFMEKFRSNRSEAPRPVAQPAEKGERLHLTPLHLEPRERSLATLEHTEAFKAQLGKHIPALLKTPPAQYFAQAFSAPTFEKVAEDFKPPPAYVEAFNRATVGIENRVFGFAVDFEDQRHFVVGKRDAYSLKDKIQIEAFSPSGEPSGYGFISDKDQTTIAWEAENALPAKPVTPTPPPTAPIAGTGQTGTRETEFQPRPGPHALVQTSGGPQIVNTRNYSPWPNQRPRPRFNTGTPTASSAAESSSPVTAHPLLMVRTDKVEPSLASLRAARDSGDAARAGDIGRWMLGAGATENVAPARREHQLEIRREAFNLLRELSVSFHPGQSNPHFQQWIATTMSSLSEDLGRLGAPVPELDAEALQVKSDKLQLNDLAVNNLVMLFRSRMSQSKTLGPLRGVSEMANQLIWNEPSRSAASPESQVRDREDLVRHLEQALESATPEERTPQGMFPIRKALVRLRSDLSLLRSAPATASEASPRTTLPTAAPAPKRDATVQQPAPLPRPATQTVPMGPVRELKLDDRAVASQAIGRLLGDEALGNRLAELKPTDAPRWDASLRAMAMLADDAIAAPDYRAQGPGYPKGMSRLDYRTRRVTGSPARAEVARGEMRQAVEAALKSPEPEKALDHALVDTFLRQIGVDPASVTDWKASAAAVRDAIDHEALIPLRSINENAGRSGGGRSDLGPQLAGVAREITRHIVEGDYADWRMNNPIGAQQLKGLTDTQRAAWRAQLTTRNDDGLTTREETGVDLLWTTKIGGPSHGFDAMIHCLLPLLANARTTPIIVDDPKWPHNGAARAYLRLLYTPDEKPVLYLEPMQREFPHRGNGTSDAALETAILRHAVQKAAALGVPLSLSPYVADLARREGLTVTPTTERYVLEPSAGVFEASDTMGYHDWPQPLRQETPPLSRVIVAPPARG
jgi:hypothetical protein